MRRSYPDAPPSTPRLQPSRGDVTNIRIGYEHPDSLLTYPDAPFLSRCAVPIQMRRSYPDAWFLSRCVVPIQKDGRWIDTTHRWVTHATMSVLSTAPAHTTYPHAHSAITICSEWRPHTPFFWSAGTQAHPGLHVHPAHTPHVMRSPHNHTRSHQRRIQNAPGPIGPGAQRIRLRR